MKQMKLIAVLGLIGLTANVMSAADATTKVTSAAKQLDAKSNYSWTTSNKEADGSGGRLGPIQGKSEKGGVTFLSFTVSEIPVEVCMKGDKGAARALEGWQTFDEVAAPGGAPAAIVRYLKSYQAPLAESTTLAGKVKELKETEGAFSGELKEESVKEMLLRGGRTREGQEPPKTTDAKGSVTFWIKDGALTKYEIKVQGKVTSGERENEINRTTTVEIKDVGTTKIELPDEAKQKLS